MLRLNTPVRKATRTNPVSALAMALALAGGAAIGSVAFATPAQAQSAEPKYSKEFQAAYKPVAEAVNGETPDIASAQAQIPAMVAQIKTADDKYAAGQLVLSIANKLDDAQLQRQALQLMVDSGTMTGAKLGQMQYFLGSLAYNAREYAAAREALQAAVASGYAAEEPEGLIVQSYFLEGQPQQGLDYLTNLISRRKAAGQAVSDTWILRGLKEAYESKMTGQANAFSKMLVANNPTQKNWQAALQVIYALNPLDPQGQLDLLRLMRATDTMSTRREFTSYVEAADPRSMSNEVLAVLQEGVAAGIFSPGDSYYTEVKGIADSRVAADRKDAANGSLTASNAASAVGLANLYFSLGEYAKAEQMFASALEKGPADSNEVLTRLGIAQANQGKMAQALETFGKVTGPRAPVAAMWSAYVETKQNPSA